MNVNIGETPQAKSIQVSTEHRSPSAQVVIEPVLNGSGSSIAHDPDHPDFADAGWCKREMERLYKVLGEAKAPNDRHIPLSQLNAIPNLYFQITDQKLSEAQHVHRSIAEVLADGKVLELAEEQIEAVSTVINLIMSDDGEDGVKKKRWLGALLRLRVQQSIARHNAAASWAYYGESDTGVWPVHMSSIHRKFFRALETPDMGVIIEAPPRHGKSLALTGYILYRIQQCPAIRILVMFADQQQGGKQIQRIKRYIRGNGKFMALFPHVKIMGRMDDEQDSQRRFTVERPNRGGREPTVEGCSISANTQGNGYDLIIADDINLPEVKDQEQLRETNNYAWFNVVERRLDTNPETGIKGQIRYVCTPWAEEDTAALIEKEIDEGRRTTWSIHKFCVLDDANGLPVSLWPELYTTQYYIDQQNDPQCDYGRLYRLQVKPQEDRLVKRVQFYPADPEDRLLCQRGPHASAWATDLHQRFRSAEQWLSIDASSTRAKTSTLTAVSQIAVVELPNSGRRAYVRKAWFFPGDPVRLRSWVIEQIIGPDLFTERYVQHDDDDAARVAKRNAALIKVQARGPIKHVLIDGQGSQHFGTEMFSHDIYRELRDMGIIWGGSVTQTDTKGTGANKQHQSKRARLAATAKMITDGFIVFPGRLIPHPKGEIVQAKYEPGPDADIIRLVKQIIDFPVGTCDGVDTITQFLLEVYQRLESEKAQPTERAVADSSLKQAMRQQIENLRKPKDESIYARDEEYEWMQLA